MQRSRPFRLVALLAICASVWVSAACEKVALTAPTGSTITIALSSTSVPINGSVDVIATVLESSGTAAHNGTKVSFIGSFGRFEPADATTQGGVATVKFIGTSSGTTKITAISGSAKAESGDLKVGGAAAGSVAMRSEPASLPQGGGTVQILATVRDSSGNLLPGAPVNFTTTQGNLGSTAGLTDANGEARVSLTTTRDADVTATVISGVAATTTVRIISAPSVTIALASTTATPGVGVGTNFTITPGAAGTTGTSIQNVTVNFGDGSAVRTLGPISGATNITHTYQTAGNFNVTATVTDATGQHSSSNLSVNVQRITPVVTLTPATATTTAGGTLAFSVSAAPGTGGPPIQNITVVANPGGATVYSGSSGGAFTRTFASAGTHTLLATATDTVGTSGSASAVVTVSNFDVTLTAAGTGISCTGTPAVCTGLTANTNVTFTASVTTAGVAASSYEWTWGDNSPTETTTARINSHRYTSAGTFIVQVTVRTTSGATATQTLTLRP